MANYVLIHGAGLGGWVWKRVADQLRDCGHTVYRPSLTGQAERSHIKGATLSTHIEDISSLIRWEEIENAILCGHSYGGVVVTGVADKMPERIDTLVYLDALVPRDGQSAFATRIEAVDFDVPIDPKEVHRVDDIDQPYVNRKLTPFPADCANEPISLTGSYDRVRRKVYIRAERFISPVLNRFYQDAVDDANWITFQVDAGHIAMIDGAREVAKILNSLGA